ncbi:MAG TPA: hypothetical protein VG223_04585, partial [Solirubrobacteraceae bacterium]|nr:hypothetical protein [Solirubrobacteraceae bacterium]
MSTSRGPGANQQRARLEAVPLTPRVTALNEGPLPTPIPQGGGSAFPPIADYAFLSDCETVALVAPSG